MQSGERLRDYVLEDRIGVGGMGQVWRARHLFLDRRVAIKGLTAQLAADAEFEERFVQEARAQANLSHPRILGVNEFFVLDKVYYLVMPLVEGESLEVLLDRQKGPLPLDRVLSIANDVLDALDYANRRGIVHRDVKPSNILLDGDGRAYLMDFGIALLVGNDRRTRTGTRLGTALYMSPEQILQPTVDHRTDVYSVGCVLYEALTGRPPFLPTEKGDTDYQIKSAHLHTQPTPIRTLNPAVPEGVAQVVMSALVKDPDKRLPGCGEFLRSLQRQRLPTLPGPKPQAEQRRPRRWLAGTTIGCLVVSVIAAVVLLAMTMIAAIEEADGPSSFPPATFESADVPVAGDFGDPDEDTVPMVVPEPHHTRLLAELDARGDFYEGSGFHSTFNPYLDGLENETEDWLYFDLEPGIHYKVLGVCDEDCSDLDFTLEDSARQEVDSDQALDAIPIVDVTPPTGGRYHLRVDMRSCSTNPCYYAVDIYQDP